MRACLLVRLLRRARSQPSPLCLDGFFLPSAQGREVPLSVNCQIANFFSSGLALNGKCDLAVHSSIFQYSQNFMCSTVPTTCVTSDGAIADSPTDVINDLFIKIGKSIEMGTAPPNAWLWSMIDNSSNVEDIKLLFQTLESLRRLRLSKLQIYENFNSHLCQRVAEACVRAGAIDFGKKALRMHNIYGLTPTIPSAHYLLQYAKKHKDTVLMNDVMKLLERNGLPLQPGTADIVFSICSVADKWSLLLKYAKRFIKLGVKLRRTSFGTLMEFVARRANVKSLWRIEELRSRTVGRHNVTSALACAKGYILEHRPDDATSVIYLLLQSLPHGKQSDALTELQKMFTQWHLEVIKNQKDQDKEALTKSLRHDVQAVVRNLLIEGIEVAVHVDDIVREEIVPL